MHRMPDEFTHLCVNRQSASKTSSLKYRSGEQSPRLLFCFVAGCKQCSNLGIGWLIAFVGIGAEEVIARLFGVSQHYY